MADSEPDRGKFVGTTLLDEMTRAKVRGRRALLLALLIVGGAAPSLASEEAEDEAHVHHRHHLGFLLGAAVTSEHGETESGFAFGVDYEYRFHPRVGAGALVEVATGELRDVVVAALMTWHPWRGLKLMAGPGVEIGDDDSEFLVRVGAAYQFKLDRILIGPEFDVDIVDGHPVYVAGLAVGIGF